MRFDAELRGLNTLPRSMLSMIDWKDVRLTLVMTLTFGQVLRMYMPMSTFSSSMPVSAATAPVVSMPHARRNASFVPSPQRISAFGSRTESSSQRSGSVSMIFTSSPASTSCLAR